MEQTLAQPSLEARLVVLTGDLDQLEIGDLNPAEPPIDALVQVAEQDRAS